MQLFQYTLKAILGISLAAACYAQAPTIASFNPPLSAVGLPVYIAGANFTGATSVTFAGRKAPFLVDSPELIVALVPLGASTGFVKIVTPSGPATSSQPYDIISNFWDAVQNFSIASNPNGAWIYGSEPSLGGAFTPLPDGEYCATDVPCWWNGKSFPNSAAVEFNASLYTQHIETIIAPDNLLWLAPEANVVVARWTAPVSGRFWIFGEFQGLDVNLSSPTVAIYENGTQIYTNTLTFFGQYQTFNLSGLNLMAGTTIDFVATSTDAAYDNVGLTATIDQIK